MRGKWTFGREKSILNEGKVDVRAREEYIE